MSRARSGGQRLFVAAYPTRECVESLRRPLCLVDLPPHRMTPDDQVHLTLHFIGETPERDVERVIESVERSTGGLTSCDLEAVRLITLPRRGPARLVAAEIAAAGSLPELQRRLVQRLARNPRAKSGDRYLPHITLCRFRKPTRFRFDPEQAAFDSTGRSDAGVEPGPAPSFPLSEVVVVRSILRDSGAEHVPIARFPLARPGST